MGGAERPVTPTSDHHSHALSSVRPRSLLLFAAVITGLTFAVELAGASYSRSMALLSDAGHVLMDFSALLISLFAMGLAERPVSDRRTYGLHRLEVLAALVNGLLVLGLAAGIVIGSLSRLKSGVPPRVGPMVALGAVGLVANLFVAWKLHGYSSLDINIRASFLHLLSDALASVGVIGGGALIALTGWTAVDPLVGIAIAAVILVNALRLLRDALNLLLEGVPPGLHVPEMVKALEAVPGVVRVEDVHVWGLCSHLVSLSARVTLDANRMREQHVLLKSLTGILQNRFRIGHATIQLEGVDWHPVANDG